MMVALLWQFLVSHLAWVPQGARVSLEEEELG